MAAPHAVGDRSRQPHALATIAPRLVQRQVAPPCAHLPTGSKAVWMFHRYVGVMAPAILAPSWSSSAGSPQVNEVDASPDRGRTASLLGRSLGIVAIFVVVGPPLGAVALWLEAIAIDWWSGRSLLQPGIFRLLGLTLLISYPVAGGFALFAGIVQSLATLALRWHSIWVPVIVGCAISALATAGIVWLLAPSEFQNIGRQFVKGVQLLLAPSLIANLVCWRLSRAVVGQ